MPFDSDFNKFPEDIDDFSWFGELFTEEQKKDEDNILWVLFEDERILYHLKAVH